MSPLVLQSDFGLDDGAVSAMYGVAVGVSSTLHLSDFLLFYSPLLSH